jgi:hypothetical protein
MRRTVKQANRKVVLKKPRSGLEARRSCADDGDVLDGMVELEGGFGFGLSFRRALEYGLELVLALAGD